MTTVSVKGVIIAFVTVPDPRMCFGWNRDNRPHQEALKILSPLFASGDVDGRRRVRITVEDFPDLEKKPEVKK